MRSKNEDTLNEILNFINDWYFQNNDYPTLMQIADNFNIGTTTAHRYVAELINRGEIYKNNRYGSLLKTHQKEINKSGAFKEQIYKETSKKYANWLVNTEIANEINPVLREDYKYVIELLRLCGSRDLSVKTFTERYNSVKHEFRLLPLDLLEFLYSVGIIENTWKDKTGRPMHRSIFRNEGDFDRNLQLRIIPAVWNGLTV